MVNTAVEYSSTVLEQLVNLAMSVSTSESLSLLPLTRSGRYFKAKVFISSKAACLILLWNFSVLLGYKYVYNIEAIMQVSYAANVPIVINGVYGIIAVVSPVIGLLTDIKISRHKAVMRTSHAIFIEVLLIPIVTVALSVPYFLVESAYTWIVIFSVFFVGAMSITFIVFLINAFQFGMDQLQDGSTEDLLLYIHWYVWIHYVCALLSCITWNLFFYNNMFRFIDTPKYVGMGVTALIFISILTLLIVSMCVMKRKKAWFLLEPPVPNPYKLVYGIVKFACQHKVPLRRSAFTYCEDEAPSRLDLGKTKYGGPFTMRQVEDVKAFLGILKVLLVLCPVFLLQTVMKSTLPAFARHGNFFVAAIPQNGSAEPLYRQVYIEGFFRHTIISNGLLSPMLVVVCIPLYLWCVRPCILYHIPGFFKRIGVGMFLIILSLLCALVMDVVVHMQKVEDAHCMFVSYTKHFMRYKIVSDYPDSPLFQNVYFLVSQYTLSALVDMLLDIAVLEFICSQSPYSMKGLVFGLLFSLKSFFQAVAVILVVPYGRYWPTSNYALHCGSGFYLVNILLAVLTLCLFSYMARRYKYKIMNEPSREYQYAEDYYSNIQ